MQRAWDAILNEQRMSTKSLSLELSLGFLQKRLSHFILHISFTLFSLSTSISLALNLSLNNHQSKFQAARAHHLGISYYANFLGRLGSNGFQLKWRFGTHGNWKNQNPGGRSGATS